MKEFSDAELIALIKASNHDAFDELHNRFWHSLYIITYKKIGDQEETYDLLQEMFIELWEKRETISFTNEVRNWLRNRLWFKIAIYFRNKGFKEKHQENFMLFLKTEEETVFAMDSIELKEADSHYEEILQMINDCIEDMPERMKEIFILSKTDNHSVKEIAEKLNISPKTVKVQLERATSRLRKVSVASNLSAVQILFILWLINC